ncbi:MAG: ABC transporter ATP-binding protein [Gammaproteobacteria bacterium]|nr:MAG: ABC transporter ATP-binding protein [Gammaproteobacteria bacterium]
MLTSSDIAIRVDGVSKQYRLGELSASGSFREALAGLFSRRRRELRTLMALEDVSFEVPVGQAVGLIGRNGAGKSTLLKVMSRITAPTAGRILVNGRLSSLLEVGTGFHQDLTGRENIYLNGSILGMSKAEVDAKFEQIVEFAEIERFLDTPIKRYSSGMRLRLGFAVAAHLDHDVLLVDEVLAVGDASFQKKCLGAMDDLRRGQRTILFVSHNMAAVETLCSRAIWIDRGHLRMDGDAPAVIDAYLSSFGNLEGARHDLATIEERGGSGAIRFTGMEWLDAAGRPVDVVRTGDRLRVRLYYEATERVAEPHFGFEIHSQMGTLVAESSTWSTGLEIPRVEPGRGELELEFEALNLMPGRYRISLWISSIGGIDYDLLEHCSLMDVETSDVFPSGRGADQRFGLVHFPARWRIQAGR